MKRGSGVLMHISSLFGDYGIGGFSDCAKYFVDFLSDCGFSFWQVLPFSPVDAYHSPYKSCSAFAGNPYLIDLESLQKEGLLTKTELAACRVQNNGRCDYEQLDLNRTELLFKAATRVQNRDEIEAFICTRPHLESFCLFVAQKNVNGAGAWTEWERTKPSHQQVFFWKFMQFTFFRQWREIKTYANQKGIQIIGDLPFYVSFDSADVWSHPELFLLDDENKPLAVSGVPPDCFAPNGQLWGNPLYNWTQMEQDGFSWWQERLACSFELFDSVRLDHFRAIHSFWAVNPQAQTAREGCWMSGPGQKLVDVILKTAAGRLVICEDLGEASDGVRTLLAQNALPGMRVLQFSAERDSLHLPHRYEPNCVAYTGTHDNNTLAGFLGEMTVQKRREFLSYLGCENSIDAIIQTMMESQAGLVIFPIQDLLSLGAESRMNLPGHAAGNWVFRVTKAQLDSIDRDMYKGLNRLVCR